MKRPIGNEAARQDDFRRRYAREREKQADFLAARVVEIADTVREGKKVRISQKDGTTEEHGDMDRSRLMVDVNRSRILYRSSSYSGRRGI